MVGQRALGIVGGLTRPLYRAWVRLRLWAVVRAVDVWDRLVRWYWRRRAAQAKRVVLRFDAMMMAAGYSRADRRHFWKDFIKRDEVRDHFMGV